MIPHDLFSQRVLTDRVPVEHSARDLGVDQLLIVHEHVPEDGHHTAQAQRDEEVNVELDAMLAVQVPAHLQIIHIPIHTCALPVLDW